MIHNDFIADYDRRILITGANGFIGSKVVETLVRYGFTNLRCFSRSSDISANFKKIIQSSHVAKIEIIRGNLLSLEDCKKAADGVSVIYHLAASTREKSIDAAYANSVVTTNNLLDSFLLNNDTAKRFVNVSSFTVYSNAKLKPGELLDEKCEIERNPRLRGEAYCLGKVKQEELLQEYGKKYNIPYVIIRPGVVYGPGSISISGRIGVSKLGIFFHLGGSNNIPLTYIDNCAEAIVLAGLKKGVEGEIFNIVDDDLPTSREFLSMYKKHVGHVRSIYIPKAVSYFLCFLLEKILKKSKGQLAPSYNRNRWSADWKGNIYTNEKAKRLLAWTPNVSTSEALKRYFEQCKKGGESYE